MLDGLKFFNGMTLLILQITILLMHLIDSMGTFVVLISSSFRHRQLKFRESFHAFTNYSFLLDKHKTLNYQKKQKYKLKQHSVFS